MKFSDQKMRLREAKLKGCDMCKVAVFVAVCLKTAASEIVGKNLHLPVIYFFFGGGVGYIFLIKKSYKSLTQN